MDKNKNHSEWVENLHHLYEVSSRASKISLQEILEIFSGKGIYFLIILLLLPFCLPIPLPGLSTPFGILITLISLRLLFRRHVYYPKWLLSKKISSKLAKKIASKLEKLFLFFEKFSKQRALFFIEPSLMKVVHALFFCCGGLLLALPLPIPMTNIIIAWPMVVVAFGISQEDGWIASIGYLLLGLAVVLVWILIGK